MGQKALSICKHETILLKLAMTEAQQRHQGQFLQQIQNAVNKESDDSCKIPEGGSLPVQNMAALTDLEKTLDDANCVKKLVICHISSDCLCIIYVMFCTGLSVFNCLVGLLQQLHKEKPDFKATMNN